MSPFTIASALTSGAVVGALLGLFSGGGSVLPTPLLLYVVGIRDPHVAIGTSAATVALNAAINLLGHLRRPDVLRLGEAVQAGPPVRHLHDGAGL